MKKLTTKQIDFFQDEGYVGVPKAVEGFIHEKESGQVARLVHYF